MALAPILLALGASTVFVLGLAHLWLTFKGHQLQPRPRELRAAMEEASLVITRETTLWRAWIGFNASHSLGAMLFGAVYVYLAVAHPATLFASPFLQALGLAVLASYLVLAKRYWFSVPLRGLALATLLYVAALAVPWI